MIGERRNCDPGLLLSIDFTKCDGEYFRSQDAYGNRVQMIGNLWRLDGAKLNGSSDYFVVPDRDNLSFGDGTNDKPFSISAWVNMDDATNFIIASKGVYNTNGEFRFGVLSNDKIYLILFDESIADSAIGRRYDTALTSYEGQWIHLIATYDGRGGNAAYDGMNIYLNGNVVDDVNYNVSTYTAMENLGADVWTGVYEGHYADGQISGMKIWNRVIGIVEDRRRSFEEKRK